MSSQNFIFPPPPPPPPIVEPQSYPTHLQIQNQHVIGFRDCGNGRNRGGTGQRLGRGREAATRGSRGGRGRGGHDYGGNVKPYGYSQVSNGGYNSQGASYSSDNGHPLSNYPQAQFTMRGHHGYEASNHPKSSEYRADVQQHTSQAHQIITPLHSREQCLIFNRNQHSIPGEYHSQSIATPDVRVQPFKGVGSFQMSPFIRMRFDEESRPHSRQNPLQSLQGGPNYETLRYQQSSENFVPSHPGDSQKRMHAEAFGSTNSAVSRPMAPPSVPSFGAALPREPLHVMEKARRPNKKARKHNQLGLTPKTEEHESSSEEDVDEESRLAAAHRCSAKPALEQLQFSYKGQLAVLKTPSDIAAWIEERKKRFPTRKRAEEAAVRKEKVREAGKIGKQLGKKDANRATTAGDKKRGPFNEAAKAKLKAEKLRKQYEKAQQRVAEFEAQQSPVHVANQTVPIHVLKTDKLATTTTSISEVANEVSTIISNERCNETTILENTEKREPFSTSLITARGSPSVTVSGRHERKDYISNGLVPSTSTLQPMASVFYPEISSAQASQPRINLVQNSKNAVPSAINETTELESDTDTSFPTASSAISCSDVEETSSSGSSSEDDRPVESSFRDPRPIFVLPPKATESKTICKVFLTKGRCPRGDRCHYRHELPERGSGRVRAAKENKVQTVRATNGPKVERVSLYQRMLIQQQEKDDELLLQHIIFLGEHGALKIDE